MSTDIVYEITRYAVDTDAEVLIERVQLLRDGPTLRRRDQDGTETRVCRRCGGHLANEGAGPKRDGSGET